MKIIYSMSTQMNFETRNLIERHLSEPCLHFWRHSVQSLIHSAITISSPQLWMTSVIIHWSNISNYTLTGDLVPGIWYLVTGHQWEGCQVSGWSGYHQPPISHLHRTSRNQILQKSLYLIDKQICLPRHS